MPRVINLLPGGEQQSLGYERRFMAVRRFVIWSAISYAILLGGLAYWRFDLDRTLQNVDADIDREKQLIAKQDNDQVKQQIVKDNNVLSDYNTFAAANPQWSGVLAQFAKLVPGDVIITSFNANTKSGKIDITGIAANRDSEAVTLRNNLAASPLFKSVNLPFENLQKATNVDFSYTFYLNDNILKNPYAAAK